MLVISKSFLITYQQQVQHHFPKLQFCFAVLLFSKMPNYNYQSLVLLHFKCILLPVQTESKSRCKLLAVLWSVFSQNFMAIHLTFVEIFQFRPKQLSNRPADNVTHEAKLLPWLKTNKQKEPHKLLLYGDNRCVSIKSTGCGWNDR